MSASQSNLSDPRYGFDLVVAVTQKSINTTLVHLLDGLAAPEVTICYVYDDSNNLTPIDYKTLLSNAQGSDPFQVPDGTTSAKNHDLQNLTAASFAAGVKAMIGLPDVDPKLLPAIATLRNGTNAPVLFNLLCAEFQITRLTYGPRGPVWAHASQPSGGSGSPWYFSMNVQLNTTAIDPKSPVPPAVQQRISDLQHQVQNAFTIEKLFLDLDTAALESFPTIPGIDAGSAFGQLIAEAFTGAYFTQLRQAGEPVLGYSFTVDAPRRTTLELGSVSRECCTLLDSQGQQITNPPSPPPNATAQQKAIIQAQQEATTLVYIGTQSTTPQVPVPFLWNWMELNDVTAFSAVQSVRRDIFLTYLAGLINADVNTLSVTTKVTATGDDAKAKVNVLYTVLTSPAPGHFKTMAIGAPGADGFTDVLSLTYTSNASADQHFSAVYLLEQVWSDFNYNLNGTVAVKGNQIRVKLHATVFLSFSHRETFAPYTDLPGANYYDKTLTVLYTLGVDQNGVVQVVPAPPSLTDNSAPWNFHPSGLEGLVGAEADMKAKLTDLNQLVTNYMNSSITTYATEMSNTINGYRAWVFAGNDAFTFKNVGFSQGLDLIAQLTYINPS